MDRRALEQILAPCREQIALRHEHGRGRVVVVNIDDGSGAAAAATRINQQRTGARRQ